VGKRGMGQREREEFVRRREVPFSAYYQTTLFYEFDFQFFLLQPCTHTFNRATDYLIDGLQIEMQGNKNKEKRDLSSISVVNT
jgi:hypothetical protein